MLTKVEAVTAWGTILALPLQDSSAGFVVQDISGLDPVKSTIVSSKFAQVDGTKRQSSSRENRNIIFTIGYDANYASNDIRSLRNYLYEYLMPKSTVLLKFYEDDVLFVQIYAEVESCETPLFAKEPEVVVSLLSFDPDFISPSSVVVPGNSVSTTTEQSVVYPGTSQTGIEFTLNITRTLTSFNIYNRIPSGVVYSMEIIGDFIAGDILFISTVTGKKGAWLTRAGSKISMLYVISPSSAWINLYKGTNHIRVYATGAGAAMPFTIQYVAKYGGL